MDNNKNNEILKDEIEIKLLDARAKLSLLHPIDIDFDVSSSYMDGVKMLSFEVNTLIDACVDEMQLID